MLDRVAIGVAAYLAVAYLVAPAFWRHYEHLPAMATLPKITRTPAGLPGDPLNVALVGSESDMQRAFAAAAWHPADPITLRSSLGIAESVLLDRPDPDAPVSTLLLFGRRQDLAFEQDVGRSARERSHVRFWRSGVHEGGRDVWVGSATFDRAVGLSRTTGQITHHIAPDVDAERDGLMRDLARAGQVERLFAVTGVGPTIAGHNGGGDRYFTDGELAVGVLAAAETAGTAVAHVLASPPLVVVKNQFWSWMRPLMGATEEPASSDQRARRHLRHAARRSPRLYGPPAAVLPLDHLCDPHQPYTPHSVDLAALAPTSCDAEVAEADRAVGRILAWLRSQRPNGNTGDRSPASLASIACWERSGRWPCGGVTSSGRRRSSSTRWRSPPPTWRR